MHCACGLFFCAFDSENKGVYTVREVKYMHIHTEVNGQFPVRNTKEQKAAFRDYLTKKAETMGYSAVVEPTDKKRSSNNVVVGSPDKARVVFTAHYDTPNRAMVPNMMMPRCKVASFAYALMVVAPVLAVALGFRILLDRWIGIEALSSLVFLIVYFGLFYFMMLGGPKNPNNANDNTSGIATLLQIMEQLPVEERQHAAFIFFDNEEKGLLGSGGYAKLHPELKKEKLIINLDCVANGDQLLVIARKKAEAMKELQVLKMLSPQDDRYQVHFFGQKGSMMNSDHKRFDRGVGIFACKKAPVVGFACGRIHTPRDTHADAENMNVLADWMVRFVCELTDQENA